MGMEHITNLKHYPSACRPRVKIPGVKDLMCSGGAPQAEDAHRPSERLKPPRAEDANRPWLHS